MVLVAAVPEVAAASTSLVKRVRFGLQPGFFRIQRFVLNFSSLSALGIRLWQQIIPAWAEAICRSVVWAPAFVGL